MGELRINDATLRKTAATSDGLADVIHSIDNGNAIRGSNDGAVNGGLGAAIEKTAGYFEETVDTYAKHLKAYLKTTKRATEDFAPTGQANASSLFSTQQELVQIGSRPRAAT